MAEKDAPTYPWLIERRYFPLVIVLVFVILSSITFLICYRHHATNIERTLKEDRSTANLLSLILDQRLKRVVAVMESYSHRPLLLQAVRDKSIEKTKVHLVSLTNSDPGIDIVVITDRQGTLWAAYPERPEVLGKNFAYRDWYKGVSKEWKPSISDAVLRVVREKDLAIQVSVPFFDEEGKVIGILLNTQRTVDLGKLIEQVPLDPGASISLTDRKGQIMYSSRYDYEKKITLYPFQSGMKKAMTAKNNTFAVKDPNPGGGTRYISFSPVGDIGWTVLVGRDKSNILQSESGYYIQVTVISFLLFLSLVLFLAYLRKQVTAQRVQEQLEAEKKIRAGQERYKLYADVTMQIAWMTNDKGEIVEDNPSWRKYTGRGYEEIEGFGWLEDIHPDDRDSTEKMWRKAVAGKSLYETEYRLRRYDGVYRDYLARGIPSFAENGNVQEWVGTCIDITDRKKAEEALREEQHFAYRLIQTAQTIILLLDTTGHIVSINPYMEGISGYTLKEVQGKDWFSTFLPEYTRDLLRELYLKAISDIQTRGNVSPIVTRDGRELQIEWYDKTLKDESGNIKGLLCIGQDVSERKRAEEERNKLRAQLSNAMEIACLGHWEYDVINDIFTFNDHFYKIFRTTAEHVGGYKMSSAEYARRFVHPDDMRVVEEETRKAIEATDPHFNRQLEHRILYADGTAGHISIQFFIVKDAHGRTVKTYGVNQDITARKRMEEELLRVQKLESIGILAGGIAHDFNNILTVIIGNISFAKNQVRPEDETFELLTEAETASTRAQTLTKQLLTFAKGGSPLKETASIKDILKESCSFVLRGSKSSCEFPIREDLWPVDVDVGQISQVINNIVINANQAMPKGGIIQVAAENLIIEDRYGLPVNPGRYIRISIKDQGVGITKEHLANIFDPYFTTKQEGSGLGLATTYSIIKNHDGHITVESQLGVGTTFHIYLPASERAVPEKEEIKLIKGQGRILVMDDEAPLRKMVGRMLQNLGYEAEVAKDGAEAIQMVKKAKETEKPYDAVILDLTIPGGMGGKEAIKKLLEIDPEVNAIVSSGYSDDPVLANFQEYGFKGMMPKPFEFQSLSKVLHEVLKGEKK
jgi:PAS domain S-box-containing protein